MELHSHQYRCSLGMVWLALVLCCVGGQTGCERGGSGSGQLDCAYDQVLSTEEAPCLCGDSVIDATELTGECYCRTSGFECFDPSDCEMIEIADASALWEVVPRYFPYQHAYSTGPLPVTVDLVATTDLVVDASDICSIDSVCGSRFLKGAVVAGLTFEVQDDS